MLTRRAFLATASAAGASVAFAANIPGLAAAANAAVPVRRSLGEIGLDDKDLGHWRDFVGHMKSLPPSAPVSWVGFADIHGTPQGFNLCPHNDWYFLPWHRGYVSMYEQAVRAWTGDATFAMPYWDWTTDRQIPRAYSDPTYDGQPNPLYDSSRTMSATASLPDDMVGPRVIADILATTSYEVFGTSRNPAQNDLSQQWIPRGGGVSGPLESNPHNRVHCAVGGQMCSATSAQDPIFFMHHGNIDRLWALWNRQGNSNTTDSLWADMPFQNNFRRMDGTDYTVVSRDTQDTLVMGYTYEFPSDATAVALSAVTSRTLDAEFGDVLRGASVPSGIVLAQTANSRAATALDPLGVSVNVSAAEIGTALGDSIAMPNTFGAGRQFAAAPSEIVAIIRDVPPPSDDTAEYRVFVNCDYLSLEVPTSDPHYVTTFGFFGTAGEHAGHGGGGTEKAPPSYLVNLTETLQRLARLGQVNSDDLVVQILPVPREGISPQDAAPITPGSVEVAIL